MERKTLRLQYRLRTGDQSQICDGHTWENFRDKLERAEESKEGVNRDLLESSATARGETLGDGVRNHNARR
eukprot:scaffold1793_cov163-Alexandrium_tamarense.AAC.5